MWNHFYVKLYCLFRLCRYSHIEVSDEVDAGILVNRELYELDLTNIKKKQIENIYYRKGIVPSSCPGRDNPNPVCLDHSCPYVGYIFKKVNDKNIIDEMDEKLEDDSS